MLVICNGGPHDGEYEIQQISEDLSGPQFAESAWEHSERHSIGDCFMIRDPNRTAMTMHKYKLLEKSSDIIRYQHVEVMD